MTIWRWGWWLSYLAWFVAGAVLVLLMPQPYHLGQLLLMYFLGGVIGMSATYVDEVCIMRNLSSQDGKPQPPHPDHASSYVAWYQRTHPDQNVRSPDHEDPN